LIEQGQRPELCFPCPGISSNTYASSRHLVAGPARYGLVVPAASRTGIWGALVHGRRGGRFAPVAVAVVVAAMSAMCVATRTMACRSRARPRGCSPAAYRHGVGPLLESGRRRRDGGVALCLVGIARCAELCWGEGSRGWEWDSGKLQPCRGRVVSSRKAKQSGILGSFSLADDAFCQLRNIPHEKRQSN
jgi:hypothetical protein